MITGLTGLTPANEQFVASVENLQNQLTNADNQLSSGLRVNVASDAPGEVEDIFQARSDLASVNQTTQNLTNVQAQVNAGDSSLQSAINLF
jgi:flagellin-like hook-associated protein FlgL